MVDCPALTGISGLAGAAQLEELGFYRVANLTSLRALEECPALQELELVGCPLVDDIPVGSLTTLSVQDMDWKDLSRLADHKPLCVLDIRRMPALEDISALVGLRDLTEVRFGASHALTGCRSLLDLPSLERVTMT
ncbi:hypothetical protein AB5J72_48065 [Streptomyces sp. CG1]|uniref:hypothetical protein n=1 Tax=Streptomyces sp. CG1 TaxID=1287523 RepID=UPI0034E26F45